MKTTEFKKCMICDDKLTEYDLFDNERGLYLCKSCCFRFNGLLKDLYSKNFVSFERCLEKVVMRLKLDEIFIKGVIKHHYEKGDEKK